jgi:hypothetical protein
MSMLRSSRALVGPLATSRWAAHRVVPDVRRFGSQAAEEVTETHVVSMPDQSTSGTSTLGLPGGKKFTDRRTEENARIASDLRRLSLPDHGRIHERDVLWCSPDVTFVGIGGETTWPGFRAALHADVFRTRRVVAVRDCFDRGSERRTLRDFCGLPADDVLAVTKPVIHDKSFKRLVNEYTRPEGVEDGRFYSLVKNDLSFVWWIHHNGFRLLSIADKEALRRVCDGEIPTQQSSNHCLSTSSWVLRLWASCVSLLHLRSAVR